MLELTPELASLAGSVLAIGAGVLAACAFALLLISGDRPDPQPQGGDDD